MSDSQPHPAVTAAALLPRFIRLRDASFYLGMDRNRFNAVVRPCLTTIPIGRQGVAFDRLELDAWVADYVSRNGRPAAERRKPWDEEERQASLIEAESGTSTKPSEVDAFAKALASAASKKRRII
jgi:predicted DNA-binding transcriptional regulator AlpA